MAISYASSGFTFVDSQFGSASAANIKSLVNVAIDRRYHKEVQAKLFWTRNGLIGPDTYSEGTGVSTAPGYPIIRKTDLTKNPVTRSSWAFVRTWPSPSTRVRCMTPSS